MSTPDDFGILVLGHKRPNALRNVLESLKRQGALGLTQVWLDGPAFSPPEVIEQVLACRDLALEYPETDWNMCNGRLGIDKLLFDGLAAMVRRYEKVLILEDDCFPTSSAVATFREELGKIDAVPDLFSVYGHHFGVSAEGESISRFQGWGWGTTREKLAPIFAQLKELFLLPESEFLAWVARQLTPEVRARIDVTPGRDALNVMQRFFVWDACTTLLTATAGLRHKRTPVRTIYNCGIGPFGGHFFQDQEHLRLPPWNMIAEDEVWKYF